jgi:hypothetical protein
VFLSDRIPRFDAIVITRGRSTYQYTHSSASFRNPFQFGVCVTNDLAIASFSCMDRYNNNDNNNKETLKTNCISIVQIDLN